MMGRNAIVDAYSNGRIDRSCVNEKLAELDRDYESTYPVSTVSDWSKRAEKPLPR